MNVFKLAVPEAIVVAGAFLVLLADWPMGQLERRLRFLVGAVIACATCGAAVAWLLLAPIHGIAPGGMLVSDPLVGFVQVALLILTAFTVLLSVESDFTTHAGEYLALLLLGTVGMMFLVASENMLMVFISLELTSLSLYILAAFNKGSIQSAEAALKYFLFGGLSAAFVLFGFSWIYGLAGTTELRGIAAALSGRELEPLLIVAIILVIAGFGFKVAAAPFHLWAPDAYQGAPTPSAAFIASGSKVAGFFIFAKFMTLTFAGVEGSAAWRGYAAGWVPAIGTVAALSMLLGNLAAIVQSSVRRLLAYSAIAHGGYMLLAVMAHDDQSLASLIYYATTYAVTVIGAFGVVAVVEKHAGAERLESFAGLSRRAPLLAFCMLMFLLSLAGIPPLPGFFGKFYVFAAALNSGSPQLGLLWLVVLALAMSAVSLYYYLQVLKQIYVAQSPEGEVALKVPVLTQTVLCVLGLVVLATGLMPGLLLKPLWQILAP